MLRKEVFLKTIAVFSLKASRILWINKENPLRILIGIKDIHTKAFAQIVQEENLSATKTEKLIEDYLFAEREPLRDEILELVEGEKPGLLQRKKLGDRILKRIKDFVETFINGMVG